MRTIKVPGLPDDQPIVERVTRGRFQKLSPATREQLEAEVKALLQKAEANAMRILKENRKELERLAQGLLAHETLDRKEIDLVLAGKKLIEPCNRGIGGSSNASKMSNAWRRHWLRCCRMRFSR